MVKQLLKVQAGVVGASALKMYHDIHGVDTRASVSASDYQGKALTKELFCKEAHPKNTKGTTLTDKHGKTETVICDGNGIVTGVTRKGASFSVHKDMDFVDTSKWLSAMKNAYWGDDLDGPVPTWYRHDARNGQGVGIHAAEDPQNLGVSTEWRQYAVEDALHWLEDAKNSDVGKLLRVPSVSVKGAFPADAKPMQDIRFRRDFKDSDDRKPLSKLEWSKCLRNYFTQAAQANNSDRTLPNPLKRALGRLLWPQVTRNMKKADYTRKCKLLLKKARKAVAKPNTPGRLKKMYPFGDCIENEKNKTLYSVSIGMRKEMDDNLIAYMYDADVCNRLWN